MCVAAQRKTHDDFVGFRDRVINGMIEVRKSPIEHAGHLFVSLEIHGRIPTDVRRVVGSAQLICRPASEPILLS